MAAKKPRPILIEERPTRSAVVTEQEFMARLEEWPKKVDELIKKHTSKIPIND